MRDLPVKELSTIVKLDYRKIKCAKCDSYRVEKLVIKTLGGSTGTNKITQKYSASTKNHCLLKTAKEYNLNWRTVKIQTRDFWKKNTVQLIMNIFAY